MKVDNIEISGINSSFKASKYPMAIDTELCNEDITNTIIKLGHSNGGHDQALTGILVSFDLTFSNKAWVELERYKFINFISSQSTMHRITKLDIQKQCNEYVWDSTIEKLQNAVKQYNILNNYKKTLTKHEDVEALNTEIQDLYLEILYNIPSGFELTARLTTNYRCLKNVYSQRKNHRLPEWQSFCKWIETLPHFKELCL